MPKITFKEAHVMGEIMRSRYEVDHLLTRLAEKYPGDSYDLVRRNCNHFANELCVCLTGKKIPAYINRPANVGRYGPLRLFFICTTKFFFIFFFCLSWCVCVPACLFHSRAPFPTPTLLLYLGVVVNVCGPRFERVI
jgi:hypothetical protein